MTIDTQVREAIALSLTKLFEITVSPDAILIQKTRVEFSGDFTLVVFPYSKTAKLSPEATAEKIGEELMQNQHLFAGYNVVKGFLNLQLKDAVWQAFFEQQCTNSSFGFTAINENDAPILVEYSSPNTNKPLHLGHVRNNLLGYSIAKILEANGKKVLKVNIVNDRGIHICKSMLAYQLYGENETPKSSGMKGDHLVGKYYVEFDKRYKQEVTALIADCKTKEEAEKNAPLLLQVQDMLRKWEAGDEATMQLWKKMNTWVYEGFEDTYKMLGVDFDKIYYESETYLTGKQKVEEGLAKGVFFKKEDGSVWIDLTKEGLDEKVVMRGDGTSLYITQDIGTSITRHEDFGFDKMIYVVGNEQDYHFKVLFSILQKFGFEWAKGLYHCSYGMVELPEGKMKSREGTVVDADDLIYEMIYSAQQTTEELGKAENLSIEERKKLFETIGMGALKYFILKVDPKKKMLFNPKESIDFQGNTGPFIQYTHARIKSILRKAGDYTATPVPSIEMNTKERDLVRLIYDFEQVVKDAGANYSPAVVANYVYELAKAFNQFYHDFSILKETDESVKLFRLYLIQFVAQLLKNGMNLLGAEVPEQM